MVQSNVLGKEAKVVNKTIGKGSFMNLYEASLEGKHVAVAEFRTDNSEELIKMYERELRALALCRSHPIIVGLELRRCGAKDDTSIVLEPCVNTLAQAHATFSLNKNLSRAVDNC